MHKAESAVLVQLRTGHTGLRHFLKKLGYQDTNQTSAYAATGPETPRHVLLDCPDEEELRKFLRETQKGNLDLRKLLDTGKGARVASRWIVKSGRIAQFRLASQLLYEEEDAYIKDAREQEGTQGFIPSKGKGFLKM